MSVAIIKEAIATMAEFYRADAVICKTYLKCGIRQLSVTGVFAVYG